MLIEFVEEEVVAVDTEGESGDGRGVEVAVELEDDEDVFRLCGVRSEGGPAETGVEADEGEGLVELGTEAGETFRVRELLFDEGAL